MKNNKHVVYTADGKRVIVVATGVLQKEDGSLAFCVGEKQVALFRSEEWKWWAESKYIPTPIAHKDLLKCGLEKLGLPSRIRLVLNHGDINTIGDLIEWGGDELKDFRGIGPITVQEIQDKLAENGLHLADA